MHKNILKYFKKPEKSKFDKKQLKEGIEVEKEHTSHPDIAQRISEAHLSESPDYYKKLKIMERVKLSDMKTLVKAEDGVLQEVEVSFPNKELLNLSDFIENIYIDILLDNGAISPECYHLLKKNAQVDGEGLLYVTQDDLKRIIENSPKRTYSIKNTVNSSIQEHEERYVQGNVDEAESSFDIDEHLDRPLFLDYDKALQAHKDSFDHNNYLDRGDYEHNLQEASEIAKRNHYKSVHEMANDQGHSFFDDKMFRAGNYERDLDKVKEEHEDNFDSRKYLTDDFMTPEYHDQKTKKLQEVREQAAKDFDSSEFENKEKLFQDTYGHESGGVDSVVCISRKMEEEIRDSRLWDVFEEIFEDKRVVGWIHCGSEKTSFPSIEFDLLISKFQKNYNKNDDLANKYWELWKVIGCDLQPSELLGTVAEKICTKKF